jgi:hypothetical protein
VQCIRAIAAESEVVDVDQLVFRADKSSPATTFRQFTVIGSAYNFIKAPSCLVFNRDTLPQHLHRAAEWVSRCLLS